MIIELKKSAYYIIMILFIIGVSNLALVVHESVHVFQADKVERICYEVGNPEVIAKVYGDFGGKSVWELELIAYIIGFLFMLFLVWWFWIRKIKVLKY